MTAEMKVFEQLLELLLSDWTYFAEMKRYRADEKKWVPRFLSEFTVNYVKKSPESKYVGWRAKYWEDGTDKDTYDFFISYGVAYILERFKLE